VRHVGLLADGLPVASLGLQQLLHAGVERFLHAPILVKNSLERKEHITKWLGQSRPMTEKPLPINAVVAQNLAYWMDQVEGGMTQARLAELAGVSQKTVSN
jgi:hypothetical protein